MICTEVAGMKRILVKIVLPVSLLAVWMITCYPICLKSNRRRQKRFSIMSLTDTPNANRLHIALFGRRNSGKSSLINALTGQDTALVSDTPGTTTDPVAKAMEIHGIGPCLFIDTPGFDDEGELGRMRIERTWKAVEKTDMAILFCGGDTSAELSKETKEPDFTEELYWLEQLKAKGIPTILLINKTDIRKDSQALAIKVRESFGDRKSTRLNSSHAT